MVVDDGLRSIPCASSAKLANDREGTCICIFDEPDNSARLSEALSKVGFRTIECLPRSNLEVQPPLDAVHAAIISDSIDNPLQRAAEMSTRCPVLYITTALSIDARLASVRAGVDAVLPRPVDFNELLGWLHDLVGSHRHRPISVLIVDDDEVVAETYALALENAGMRTCVRAESATALGEITATYPDLVLLDMQMPDVSGMELAKMIRQSRRHLSLPIVFLSAERDPALQLKARILGGDDFISKSVDPEMLVSLVRMRAERAMRLRSIMDRDCLTGLLNRGRFIDRLYQEFERCRRTDAEMSLALIDLDHFKNVNDTYGHLSGDEVLRTLAHSLSSGLRGIDVIGRYGGEEFGVILLGAPPEGALIAVEKVRQRFSEIMFHANGNAFSATFSAGISSCLRHRTHEKLIASADSQMYVAKAAGRNRASVESPI